MVCWLFVATLKSTLKSAQTLQSYLLSKEAGSRGRGDWGGLIINGNTPINACAEEGEFCEAFGEGGTGFYSGTNPEDNSGILKYVRVEFAGTLFLLKTN